MITSDFKLIHGIYESVITHALAERLNRISDCFDVEKNQLDSEESSFALARHRHLTKLMISSLASIVKELPTFKILEETS